MESRGDLGGGWWKPGSGVEQKGPEFSLLAGKLDMVCWRERAWEDRGVLSAEGVEKRRLSTEVRSSGWTRQQE